MKLLELNLSLRYRFEELSQLFAIFNNMILDGNTCKVSIASREAKNYLHIEIFRCKKAFASIEITRLLDKQVEISEELINSLNVINSKNVYPHFSVDSSFSIVTIAVHDKKYEPVLIPEVEEVSYENRPELMHLDFSLRKPFPQLPDLILAINHMFSYGYNVYISFETSRIEKNCSYLSFRVTFKNVLRPSMIINVGYSKTASPKSKYYYSLSKWNFLTLQNPSVCPVHVSFLKPESFTHGPQIAFTMLRPDDKASIEKIESQCELCDVFFS